MPLTESDLRERLKGPVAESGSGIPPARGKTPVQIRPGPLRGPSLDGPRTILARCVIRSSRVNSLYFLAVPELPTDYPPTRPPSPASIRQAPDASGRSCTKGRRWPASRRDASATCCAN